MTSPLTDIALITERSTLGAILFDGEQGHPNPALAKVRSVLPNGEAFFLPRHKAIYEAMVKVDDDGKPVTLATLSESGLSGELAYIANLQAEWPTSTNAETHAEIVRAEFIKRKLAGELSDKIAALKNGAEPNEVVADLIPRLEEVGAASSAQTDVDRIDKVILTWPELLKADIPERKEILPWLTEGGLAMVYAVRGLGKTLFALSLASSVACGRPFMRWPVQKAWGVLFVDGEMPQADLRKRLTVLIAVPPEAPLLTLSHENFYRETERDLILTDGKNQNTILSYLDAHPEIRVLIVDNLAALTRIREDKGDEWRESFFPFLMKCRRRGVAVIIVHHAGKNGEQRGTGAREDALDITIKLSRADEDHRDGAYFRVDFTKARGVLGDTVKPFTAKLVEGENQQLTWALSDVEEDTETRLIDLINETDGISVTDAAEELPRSKGAVSKAKKRLTEIGVLEKTAPGAHSQMKLAVSAEKAKAMIREARQKQRGDK